MWLEVSRVKPSMFQRKSTAFRRSCKIAWRVLNRNSINSCKSLKKECEEQAIENNDLEVTITFTKQYLKTDCIYHQNYYSFYFIYYFFYMFYYI